MQPSRNHPIDCGLATTEMFAGRFEKRPLAQGMFLDAEELQRVTSFTGDTPISNPPAEEIERTSAGMETDFIVSPRFLSPNSFKATITSLNPDVLSDPVQGIATYQSSGTCMLRAESDAGEVALKRVTTRTIPDTNVVLFANWTEGSLARHITDSVRALQSTSSDLQLFLGDPASGSATVARNPACFANGLNLSCISPWNSTGGRGMSGTLVSPLHVLFCRHVSFFPAPGATIRFVAMDGQVINRTLLNTQPAAPRGVWGAPDFPPDLTIGTLDQPMPESFGFAKVLPDNLLDYLPKINMQRLVPALGFNQFGQVGIFDLRLFGPSDPAAPNPTVPNGFSSYEFGGVQLPVPSYCPSFNGQPYCIPIVRGASGTPVIVPINGEVVVLGPISVPGGGNLINRGREFFNNIMSPLQLTDVDLSGFPTY